MDHGHMDHGHMDHDMPGMDQGHKCNMNMLFTWDTTDLCIVFRSWHVSGTFSLVVALVGIILLTAGYEAVREASRRYEAHSSKALEGRRGGDDLRVQRAKDVHTTDESSSLLHSGRNAGSNAERQAKLVKAALYAVQVFYSFFIMLLFMTYNGWIMLAVAVGAFVGYLLFANSSPTRSAACH
ncbi:Ctr copper transporter [Didymella exigua CBS 183.55]|uniref:Copper transport protein n=1 Tax=Didymella exigua CBS 183.55 TaxID=1150837 RepID=A0A6A5S1F1_9PLEO|nr:Ctr copper transporter [Didymella exigua CBS 183.55]KAF1932316.1 Ctr copper transporter [Didymella exigua CBS 183.55]